MDVKMKLVTVTPEKAAEYLEKNFQDNRNVRQSVVAMYAADMTQGRWTQNGDTIKFDEYGNLIDGQHRLLAVIKSGVTLEMFVASGLDAESTTNVDIGAKRSAADALKMSGTAEYQSAQATLAKKILVFRDGAAGVMTGKSSGGTYSRRVVTMSQIVDFVNENDLVPFCREGVALYNCQISKILSPSDWTFLVWYLTTSKADGGLAFLQKLATLEDVAASSPVRTLFRKLQTPMGSSEKLREVDAAFGAWLAGKKRYAADARPAVAV